MRILVISDSHGSLRNIEKAIEAQPDAKHVIFLGDGEKDIEEASYIYDDRIYHIVKGNCDFLSDNKTSDTVIINGTKIYFTHKENYSDVEKIVSQAKKSGARIALYGHTHIAYENYVDGVYVMNPGSITAPRDQMRGSYGIIDITDGGIITFTVRM
ncbi:MAG: YfcE family phosphodiesterase [Clostridia bacterium]|nr:YfcE family phosphodiesterase [Clostridia bacterium]